MTVVVPAGVAPGGLFDVPLPEPGEGEVLVRTVYMSMDPSMRGRMDAAKSYAPGWVLGEPCKTRIVGEVAASRAPARVVELFEGVALVFGAGNSLELAQLVRDGGLIDSSRTQSAQDPHEPPCSKFNALQQLNQLIVTGLIIRIHDFGRLSIID